MNKKYMIPLLSIFAIALVSAGLVTYYSNTVVGDITTTSPIEITTVGEISALNLIGGDSIEIVANTKNLASVDVEDVLIEVKVTDFDGVGITYGHSDESWTGNIPVCTFGEDAYYYVGPVGGFIAPEGYNMDSTSTITADPLLEPRTYNIEIKAIEQSTRAC